jgi:hypothetical protein
VRVRIPGPPRWLRQRALRLDPREVDPTHRGFACGREAARERFRAIGAALLEGHAHAVRLGRARGLEVELARVPSELRGFAFEGAALGLALLDLVGWPPRARWAEFAHGAGEPHAYMLHVGAGLARERFGLPLVLPLAGFDPLLGALVADGQGFFAGYFRPERATAPAPARVRGYARRAWDQGLGRALWFVCGAEPVRAAQALECCEVARRGDLWSGLGLACAYAAGGADGAPGELARLARGAGFGCEVAQGACFAAEARARAGNRAQHVREACEALCGLDDERAAALARSARAGLPEGDEGGAYEAWRARIREASAERGAA